MKNITLSLVFLIFAISPIISQVKEGHIKYTISIDSNDPESEMMASMFSGSSMNIYFKNQLTHTELNMGMFMQMTVVNNEKTGEILMLMGGMMGDKAILTSAKEMNEIGGTEEEESKSKIELINETKTILGYRCKKAILKNEDGTKSTYWYTTDIKFNKKGNEIINEQIPGVPLEMTIEAEKMTMTWTAVNIEKKVDNSNELFSLEIPDGYEQISYEEFINFGE